MRRHFDYPLFFIALALAVAGLLAISSASVVVSQKNFGYPYYYLWHQTISVLIGFAFLFAAQFVPYRFWKKFAIIALLGSLVLTALVFFPQTGGLRLGGAARWVRLGPLPAFQPSELLKLSLILYLAAWLDDKRSKSKGFTGAFIPFLAIMGIVGAMLVLQPDYGTLLVVGGTAVIVYFLGGGKISQIVAIVLLAAAAILALAQFEPYRMNRLLVFLDPDRDLQSSGYHINQALIAIGTGGFWGRGYGQSIQKYNYLPEPIGDSVFAIVVEEFGFLGAAVLLALFLALFLRMIAIARRAPDFFGKLVAAGTGSQLALQTFINTAAISRALPLTGIPLPFISYGGTSAIVTLATVGIVLAISKKTNR